MEQFVDRSGEDRQDEQHSQDQRRGPQRRKRQNNKNKQDKLFICKCSKRYSSYVSWYAHFKSKVHAKDTEQQRQNLKNQMKQLNNRINQPVEGPPVLVQNIPTFVEEYQHKFKTDQIYVQICASWRHLQSINRLGNIQDVIFNRFTDKVEGVLHDFRDISRLRKEMLRKDVTNLVEQYGLQHIQNSVSQCKQFKDYQIINDNFARKNVLNFSWDLLKYFKPVFAAKIQIILYAMCHQTYNDFNMNESPSLRRFKTKWSKYTFIEPILQKYHQSWQTKDESIMNFT